MKTVLITGGAGFIGSHLAEHLLRRGYEVRVLDNFSTGQRENLSHLNQSCLEIIEGDVRNKKLVRDLVKRVNMVFHLAAVTSVPLSFENPTICEEVNVLGSLNVIQAAIESGVDRFVFPSSSAVYGDTERLPIKEDEPLKPLSPYALSKLAVEKYLEIYKEKINSVILRLFNLFGPRQDPNSDYAAVIPRFLERIKKGKEIVIFGDGEQTRDFLYINDGIEAFLSAAVREIPSAATINIGSGESLSINQLVQVLKEVSGKDFEIRYEAARPADIKHSQADIKNAQEILGFYPKWSFKGALKEVFYLSNRKPI